MSTMTAVYTELNIDALNDLADDISPYVRARNTSFPAITFRVDSEDFERTSTSLYRKLASVSVTCYARSVMEAEALGAAVLTALKGDHCNYIETLERDYEEGYDDDSVGVFMVTINYIKNMEA